MPNNNEIFFKRALEQLLNEKDIKKSIHQPLKRACEAAIGNQVIFDRSHLIRSSFFSIEQ